MRLVSSYAVRIDMSGQSKLAADYLRVDRGKTIADKSSMDACAWRHRPQFVTPGQTGRLAR